MVDALRLRAFPSVAVLVVALSARPAVGSTRVASQTSPPDSSEILSHARRAQWRFERDRRRLLPRTLGSMPHPCDERVGRFCFWHGDRDEEREPRPEDPAIVSGRLALIDALDHAAAVLPGDEWIAGQRVRYLVEAGLVWRALRAARACRAVRPGWCSALAGLAYHHAWNYPAADSAFAAALAAMPSAERCKWTDLSRVLRGKLRKTYRKGDCAERAKMEERIWWLADPLYTVPGNERRSEHYVRVLMQLLAKNASTAYGVPWGDDLGELIVRYGWAASWERERPLGFETRAGAIISHDPPHASYFLPRREQVTAPLQIAPGSWELDKRRPPTTFAPPYAKRFDDPIEHQVAVFRRGGDALVVALAEDIGTDHAVLGLALSIGPDAVAVAAPTERHWASLTVTPGTYVASVERLDKPARAAGRARFALRAEPGAPGTPAISDLLIAGPTATPLDSLTQALTYARATTRIVPEDLISVYWELYDVPSADDGFDVTLTLVKGRADWLESPADWLARSKRRDRAPISLRWRDNVHPGETLAPRSINVAMPDLDDGWYTLLLTVFPASGAPLVAARRLRVDD